ncbi:MAG TPA: undecaprenyl-diphosphate phosphatase [Bacillota bacterium]
MDLPLWKAALLGLLQGVTEFLPISSSGHLVLGQHLLGLDLPGLSFEVTVHVGTLAAVIVAYRRDVAAVLRGVAGMLRRLPVLVRDPLLRGRAAGLEPGARLAWLLVIGSVPAGVAGVAGKGWVEAAFSDLRSVGVGWLITGVLLLGADRTLRPAARGGGPPGGAAEPRPAQALWIGLCQAAAIWPGISRSGSTIAGGLFAGLDAGSAARFSFLLSIPAIAGAALLDALDVAQAGLTLAPAPLLAGFAAAAASGYAAIHGLLQLLQHGRLAVFAAYCLLLALVVLLGLT